MGSKQNPGAFDCYANALPDEPMFVLLARDSSAPDLVETWASIRKIAIIGGHRPEADRAMVDEALLCADQMRAWRKANDGRWRKQEPAPLTREQLIERLAWLATAAPGTELPEWMNESGGWGYPISKVAAAALTIITEK